ncbi:MAG: hypothetical protein AAGU04_05025 [Anaerolineaceae bacterium]
MTRQKEHRSFTGCLCLLGYQDDNISTALLPVSAVPPSQVSGYLLILTTAASDDESFIIASYQAINKGQVVSPLVPNVDCLANCVFSFATRMRYNRTVPGNAEDEISPPKIRFLAASGTTPGRAAASG